MELTMLKILPKINLLLIIFVVILIVYLGVCFLQPSRAFKLDAQSPNIQARQYSGNKDAAAKKMAVLDEGIFTKRSLFSPLLENKQPQEKGIFELAGLVSVEGKYAAMLKDVKTKKSYYCLVGDTVGIYTVKQISKDRVILESGGKTLEITK